MRDILVVFHARCMDGFAAAWAAWHWLTKSNWDNIQFLPADYADPIPDMKDKEVYIVDFSWKSVEAFLATASVAKKVVIIDHHIEANMIWANVKLPQHVRYIYDNDHSGCVLSWDYFQQAWLEEEVKQGMLPNVQGVPEVLLDIEDRDLWKFERENSKQMHACLKSFGFMQYETDQNKLIEKFFKFHEYYSRGLQEYEDFINAGNAIMNAESVLIDSILERTTKIVTFPIYECNGFDNVRETSYRVPIAEVPYDLASEAGDKLNKGYPFSVTYETQYALGRRKFSIRSNKETGIDVGAIARKEGGAGHKHAAGWTGNIIVSDDFPWRFDKN